jgi:hypothetical protein
VLLRDGQLRKEVVDEGADADGVQDGSEADAAAEQPAQREDGGLDAGADDADRVASGGEPGHQAVAGARTEPGSHVETGGERVAEDRGDQEGRADGERGDRGHQGETGVGDEADDDDVGDGAVARALPKWQPGEQDEHADAVDHPTHRQAGAPSESLVQHVPRVEAEPGPHHERDAHPEQDQAAMQLDQPSC